MTVTLPHPRAIISLTGDDRVSFLQNLLTQDIAKLNDDKIQFAALLSPQGKILHDMFLVAVDNTILIDTAAAQKDTLLKRLMLYKLRAKVTLTDISATCQPQLGDGGLPDPRHPELPARAYVLGNASATPLAPADASLLLGIPELGRDFAPDEVTALDAGYDLLHAVSFSKGCYVGQEVTARMHYKAIARRGFYLLHSDLAPPRLALLKFEEVEAAHGRMTVDNLPYRATLPAWMAPKFAQFQQAQKMQ